MRSSSACWGELIARTRGLLTLLLPPTLTPGAAGIKAPSSEALIMFSSEKQEWIDARIKERQEDLRQEFWRLADPSIPILDAGTFEQPLADVTRIITNKVERDGPTVCPYPTITIDTSIILRQLRETYNLICWVNCDEFRFGSHGYRIPYSFVILPVVRTMIDGFYNATALLDDPARSRKFRISGYFRKREALQADEARYGSAPGEWQEGFSRRRSAIAEGMRAEGITNADLDEKGNRWPLLGEYLRVSKIDPDTPRKQLLKTLTLGFWKEYSAISHASFDALVDLYPFIATDRLAHEKREQVEPAALRFIIYAPRPRRRSAPLPVDRASVFLQVR